MDELVAIVKVNQTITVTDMDGHEVKITSGIYELCPDDLMIKVNGEWYDIVLDEVEEQGFVEVYETYPTR